MLEDGEDGVVALLVSEGGLLGTSKVVPFAAVRFGPYAVMIDTAASVIPATTTRECGRSSTARAPSLGTRVVTEEGEELGRIGDLYFDETTGRITGYEVSGGKVGDLMRGTSYLPFDHIRTIGIDAVIASSSARKAVGRWTEWGRLRAAGQSPPRAHQRRVTATMRRPDPADVDPDGDLVGARAKSELIDRDGSMIVASGQTMTPELVQRARARGTLDRSIRLRAGRGPAGGRAGWRGRCRRPPRRQPTCGAGSPRGSRR